MAASLNDKFADTYNSANPNVASVTATRTAAATTLQCDDLSGWPTATKVHLSTYQINTSNAVVPGTQIDWEGIVSGNNIGSLTRITGAADTGNTIGDVVEMNPTAKWASDLVNGVLVEHNQDGTHSDVTADSITVGGQTWASLITGWQEVNDSWSYASATTITVPSDATTTYQAGMRIRLTQSTIKYFVITKVAATTLTVYGGTDYTLANAGISSISISTAKTPFGFPISPEKWTVSYSGTTDRSTTSATYASLTDAITVPIGVWRIEGKIPMLVSSSSTESLLGHTTLSSDASTETNPDLTSTCRSRSPTGNNLSGYTATPSQIVNLASQTTFTLMGKINAPTMQVNGSSERPVKLKAVCAYL